MKAITILIQFLLILFGGVSLLFAGCLETKNGPSPYGDLFDEREIEIARENLASLSVLESSIRTRGVNLANMKSNQVYLQNHPEIITPEIIGPPLGIPSYMWGFCMGIPGIFIVAVETNRDPDNRFQVNKALSGCVVGNITYGGILFLLYLSYLQA